MLKKLSNKHIFLGYFSHFLNVSIGLLLLPLIFKYIDSTGVSFWFTMITLGSLIQMLELGLLPTITRHIAYLYSGVEKITYNNNPERKDSSISEKKILKYIRDSENIYKLLSVSVLFFIGIIGSIFVFYTYQDISYVYVWSIFLLSYVINLYFNFLVGLVQGTNNHYINFISIIIQRLLILILSVLSIKFYGLYGIVGSFFIAILISKLFLLIKITNIIDLKKIYNLNFTLKINKDVIKASLDLGIVQISTFLSQRFSILYLVNFVTIEEHNKYSLTTTLLYTIFSFSSFYCNSKIATLSSCIVENNNDLLKKEVKSIFFNSTILYVSLVLFSLFSFDFITRNFSFSMELLDDELLLFFMFVIFLELIHAISSIVISTFNSIPFKKSAIITSLSICIIQIFLIPFFGVYALISVFFICNLIYNNWYWPLFCYRKVFRAKI